MSTEAWTLLGVVVGALLGGVAQVLAGLLDRRYQTTRWEREHQRDAYVRWVQYLHVLFVRSELAQRETPPEPASESATAIESDEGPRALAELRLVAPDDTYSAALRSRGAVVAIFRYANEDSEGSEGNPSWQELAALFRAARDEFIVLARRDVGALRRKLPPVSVSRTV